MQGGKVESASGGSLVDLAQATEDRSGDHVLAAVTAGWAPESPNRAIDRSTLVVVGGELDVVPSSVRARKGNRPRAVLNFSGDRALASAEPEPAVEEAERNLLDQARFDAGQVFRPSAF